MTGSCARSLSARAATGGATQEPYPARAPRLHRHGSPCDTVPGHPRRRRCGPEPRRRRCRSLRGAPASAVHAKRPSSGRDRRLAPDEGRDGPGRRWARQRIERCPRPSIARGVPRHGHRSALGTGRSGLDERPGDLCDGPERLKVRVRRDTDVERCLSPLPLMIVRNRCAWGLGGCAPG